MTELQFRDDIHEYRAGGIVLPSVTEILKATGVADDWSYVDPYYADRGTRVHDAMASTCLGFPPGDLDADVAPFYETGLEFLWKYQPEPLHVEHRMYDVEPPVAGTADLIAKILGKANAEYLTLIDWKAGDLRSYYDTQAAAYVDLARRNGIEVERAWVVSLKGDSPKVREVDLDVQLVIWRHTLEKYHGGNHASNQG